MRVIFMSDGEALYMATTFDEVYQALEEDLHVATPEEHVRLVHDEYIALEEIKIH